MLLGSLMASPVFSQKIAYQTDPRTQAITSISIAGDGRDMNWILEATGKQYPWVTEKYGWGLGYFTQETGGTSKKYSWNTPTKTEGNTIVYQAGDVEIKVSREMQNGDLWECYTFTNASPSAIALTDIGIYTPFNDNYPDAETCVSKRVNAHIWDKGHHAAYVEGLQMGGKAPHIGLALMEGAIDGYEIAERARNQGMSNFRGVISLSPSDMQLAPGESRQISWVVFPHQGKDDFYRQLLAKGSVYVECDKYVVEQGKKVKVVFHSGKKQDKVWVLHNGEAKKCKPAGKNRWEAELKLTRLGENELEFQYDEGKKTYAHCLVISGQEELISKRAGFIIENQQMNDKNDPRYGAYMVYDCEDGHIFLNDKKSASPVDRDEGAERLAMGIFLAKQYLITKDEKIKESLMRYASFVKDKLQDEDFNVWSNASRNSRNRAYNYPMVANLYFYMQKVTGDNKYAEYGYKTLQTMFKHFGYGFYAIDFPVKLGLEVLRSAHMQEEAEKLKSDYLKIADVYIRNGLNYPKHEVNYEQTIVAPSIMLLAQVYSETKDPKYLESIKEQLPALEAFNGNQPNFHLNEIAIRHWDGYWFGKREMWGDVFPHYWSTITGAAFYYYYLCTGDATYKERAENIVRNNLCLFFENGAASCAYMYPKKVNGVKAEFYDPYANDQDWALVYYLLVNHHI